MTKRNMILWTVLMGLGYAGGSYDVGPMMLAMVLDSMSGMLQ